ncbi:MAG: hypothetical protein JSW62_04090, partial [Thermoplasmatales archaeon]
MKICGDLIGNEIIIKKSKEVGRLYGKSNFGKIIANNSLKLDLIEGVFLIDEGKIKVLNKDKKELDFQNIVKLAAKNVSKFEMKYLTFRDLRKRGYAVRLRDEDDYFHFYINSKEDGKKFCFISVFSEREFFDVDKIKNLINTV